LSDRTATSIPIALLCTPLFEDLDVIIIITRMRGKAPPDGRPAVELIETLVRLSLIPTRATPLFD